MNAKIVNSFRRYLGLQGYTQFIIQREEFASLIDLVEKKCKRFNKRFVLSLAEEKNIIIQIVHPLSLIESKAISFDDDELGRFKELTFGILVPSFDLFPDSDISDRLNKFLSDTEGINTKLTTSGTSYLITGFKNRVDLEETVFSFLSEIHGLGNDIYLRGEFTYWSHKRAISFAT
ncbi:MAG: hypothetical protein AAF806_21635 [Bacteroidota bacterium]